LANPLYGGGTAAGGNPLYGGTGSAPKHHSLLHDIVHTPAHITGNLLKDIRDAAVGLPQGLVQLAEHPVKSSELIGKTTWQDWSPLFHGHVGEWAHNFAAHPLAPILDVAGFVTGGAGLLARGGEGAAALGLISKESKLAKLGGSAEDLTKVIKVEGAPEAYRQFSKNPVIRARQDAMVHLGEHLSEAAPKWFGRSVGEDGVVTRGRVADLSQAGYARRYFAKQESYRAGATKAMIGAQLGAFIKAGKDISQRPAETFLAIERHGREQLVDHSYRVSRADAKSLQKGFVFVKDASHRDLKMTPAVNSLESFKTAMEGFANRHTTRDINSAARDAKGNYLVVHKRAALAYGQEGARSATFLNKLYRYPTQAWKYLILATRPAYFVNNAVGNTFMAMAHLGPVGFARGLADAYRQVHGEKATADGMSAAIKSLHGDWQDKWFLGVHQGFAQDVMTGGTSAAIHPERSASRAAEPLHLSRKLAADGHPRVALVVKHAEAGLYPLTHKVADVFLRRTMINELMRRHPMVKRLQSEGVSFDRAASRVAADPAVRDRIQEEVNHALGDYHHLNPLEQHVRQFVPFYTWDRAIVRHGVNLTLHQPAKVAAGAAVGELGTNDTTAKLGGNIPSFLKGVVPLGHAGADGRTPILATLGLNPYASLPDVTDTVGALVGAGSQGAGETFAGQLNPIITSLIEATTGQSLLSGAKLHKRSGGIIGNVVANVVQNLPQAKLLDTIINGEAQPRPNKSTGKVTPFLYRKDALTQLEALFGVPIKKLDTKTASEQADKKAGRRKRKTNPLFG
jgi:hypothetical protein